MIPKFFVSVSLAGVLLSGAAVTGIAAQQQPQQSQPRNQNEQSKTASGKVTDIGKDKKSFSVQTNDKSGKDSSDKQTIVFVLDGNTQVHGRVSVGSDVTVEYRPTPDGNLALVITPTNSGGSQ
jgi:predicted extracellular nuclease